VGHNPEFSQWVNIHGKSTSAFYRLIQDSDGENNAIPVLITPSVSVSSLLTAVGQFVDVLLYRARVSRTEALQKTSWSVQLIRPYADGTFRSNAEAIFDRRVDFHHV
jgi:hypothetical protein